MHIDGKAHFQSFMATQLTNKETAENLYAHIVLTYGNDGALALAESIDDEGNHEQLEIKSTEIVYQDLPLNHIVNFTQDNQGPHWLGGKPPAEFQIPENICPGSFQYLGQLSKSDQAFSWLPFDLHLICPIYLDFDLVWLDYTNPLAPVLVNAAEINACSSAYADLKADSYIEFEQVRFRTYQDSEFGYELGSAGLPNWTQYPAIPFCPKTNRVMRLVCQLQSGDSVDTVNTNITPSDDWYAQYFESLNFWGDGDLFVFFEPESKMACYLIQHT